MIAAASCVRGQGVLPNMVHSGACSVGGEQDGHTHLIRRFKARLYLKNVNLPPLPPPIPTRDAFVIRSQEDPARQHLRNMHVFNPQGSMNKTEWRIAGELHERKTPAS